jgi:hypothetical protein
LNNFADDFRANIINNRATLAPSITWNYSESGKFTSEFEYNHDTQPYHFDKNLSGKTKWDKIKTFLNDGIGHYGVSK